MKKRARYLEQTLIQLARKYDEKTLRADDKTLCVLLIATMGNAITTGKRGRPRAACIGVYDAMTKSDAVRLMRRKCR